MLEPAATPPLTAPEAGATSPPGPSGSPIVGSPPPVGSPAVGSTVLVPGLTDATAGVTATVTHADAVANTNATTPMRAHILNRNMCFSPRGRCRVVRRYPSLRVGPAATGTERFGYGERSRPGRQPPGNASTRLCPRVLREQDNCGVTRSTRSGEPG